MLKHCSYTRMINASDKYAIKIAPGKLPRKNIFYLRTIRTTSFSPFRLLGLVSLWVTKTKGRAKRLKKPHNHFHRSKCTWRRRRWHRWRLNSSRRFQSQLTVVLARKKKASLEIALCAVLVTWRTRWESPFDVSFPPVLGVDFRVGFCSPRMCANWCVVFAVLLMWRSEQLWLGFFCRNREYLLIMKLCSFCAMMALTFPNIFYIKMPRRKMGKIFITELDRYACT